MLVCASWLKHARIDGLGLERVSFVLNQIVFTFAIVNWNTSELLDACLASLCEQAAKYPSQILVADNGSVDDSVQMVARKYPNVVLCCNESNLGFAKGHECLFAISKGRYHVLVNSDVKLMPGCLDAVYKRMEEHPRIGILGPQILGEDFSIQPSCRRFPSLKRQFVEASGLNRIFPKFKWFSSYRMGDFDHRSAREVDQVMGSFFVIRRELFKRIGTLDNAFFMYYEEVDYCLRCSRAGYQVFFEPEARVWHKGGGSADKVKVLTIRRSMRSMRRYFEKHFGRWTHVPLLLILSLEAVTHSGHALFSRRSFWGTTKAYALGWWDVFTRQKADW